MQAQIIFGHTGVMNGTVADLPVPQDVVKMEHFPTAMIQAVLWSVSGIISSLIDVCSILRIIREHLKSKHLGAHLLRINSEIALSRERDHVV